MCSYVLDPNKTTKKKETRLKPERRINGMRDDDECDKRIHAGVMDCPNKIALFHIIFFPKENLVDNPFRPLHCVVLHI